MQHYIGIKPIFEQIVEELTFKNFHIWVLKGQWNTVCLPEIYSEPSSIIHKPNHVDVITAQWTSQLICSFPKNTVV